MLHTKSFGGGVGAGGGSGGNGGGGLGGGYEIPLIRRSASSYVGDTTFVPSTFAKQPSSD